MITRELLQSHGFTEFETEYNPEWFKFSVHPRADLYYVPKTEFAHIVTGNTVGRGNRTLFEGHVDSMEFLLQVIKSVCYYEKP